jgi:hypothetical protein
MTPPFPRALWESACGGRGINAKVEYAPHRYIWMSRAPFRSDGLGMVSDGLELPDSELRNSVLECI